MHKDAHELAADDERQRRSTLNLLCLGVLMVMIDMAIVNVALPSIQRDLGFGNDSVVWVTSAFLIPFGGALLLGGRLGDVYGHRRLFLIGIALFTVSSLACGLVQSQVMFLAARGLQGLSGAIITSVPYAFVMNTFTHLGERAKAIGVYGFVRVLGGGVGLMLGGVLVSALNWRWVFLINVPTGVAVFALCIWRMRASRAEGADRRLDVLGAVTATVSLMLLIFAILSASRAGLTSPETLGALTAGLMLAAAFIAIEARVPNPLVPLAVFRLGSFVRSMSVRLLWAAAISPLFFVTLYMQTVLGYGPMPVALVFLVQNVIIAVLSLGVTARLIMSFGVRTVMSVALLLGTISLALLARVPVHGNLLTDVLPAIVLFALAGGLASTPMLLANMSGIAAPDSGAVSGIVNTASLIGHLIGLSIVASLAAAWTDDLMSAGVEAAVAQSSGYRIAFLIGAGWAALAFFICAMFVRADTAPGLAQQGTIRS